METNKTKEIFLQAGFSEKEASVYLALLQLGSGSVINISEKSGIKRPTCYLILNDLLNKGVVSVVQTVGGIVYKAANPEIIVGKLEIQKKKFESILPQLNALANISENKPKIELFEGKQGINSVYQIIAKEAKEVRYWGNANLIYEEYKWIFDLTNDLIYKNKIIVKDLLSNDKIDLELAKKRKELGQEIRISPNSPFANDNAIFNNKIAIFSLKKEALFAILIESQEIAESFRVLYDLAWNSAKIPTA